LRSWSSTIEKKPRTGTAQSTSGSARTVSTVLVGMTLMAPKKFRVPGWAT
jgi:hypothetical protein